MRIQQYSKICFSYVCFIYAEVNIRKYNFKIFLSVISFYTLRHDRLNLLYSCIFLKYQIYLTLFKFSSSLVEFV